MFQVIRDKDNCYYNSVDGSWKPSRTGKTIKIFSPIDGQFIGMVPSMTTEEVDEVMASAKAAQKTWKETPLIERAKVLNQAAFLLREHKEEIAKVLVKEIACCFLKHFLRRTNLNLYSRINVDIDIFVSRN